MEGKSMSGLYIGIGAAVLLLLWVMVVYNILVRKKLRIDNNFSQIKIQCKKRFDLIPNLVEVVRSYSKQKDASFDQLNTARQAANSAQSPEALAEANEQINGMVSRLEREYSAGLKSDTTFVRLQEELAKLEKAITISRQIYNDSVMMYNRSVMIFPNSLFAAIFRFRKVNFFEASETQEFKQALIYSANIAEKETRLPAPCVPAAARR